MFRQPVSSSRVLSVGWENNTLQVEFKNGAVYNYYNVSKSEYINFMNSSSLGHSISVIDKTHRYERIF